MSERYLDESTTANRSLARDFDTTDLEIVEMDPSGRYIKYNEILGKGAFKTVYRAFDKLHGIEVAWNQAKLQELLRSPDDLERFYAEVHLLKSLKHKNIIKLYNFWVETRNKNINFITEIFTSGTLRQYRKKHKHVDLKAVKHWARQILRGLLYLHRHDPPIIHRDLKCDNIFINGNVGEVKIGDFGLAAILCKAHAAHSILGTPEFMAPELYEEEYNELVDIYSFGMCLLEMITSEYPYSECKNAAQIYKKVTAGKKPAALERVTNQNAQLFIQKCLERADKRLSAKELLMDPFLCGDLEAIECIPSTLQSDMRTNDVAIIGTDWEETCYGATPAEEDSSFNRRATTAQGNAIPKGCRPEVAVSGCGSSTFDGVWRSRLSKDFCDSWMVESPIDCNQFSTSIDSSMECSRSNTIMLGLRIVNPEGQSRSIQFPFDVDDDTALTVATEMINELNLSDQDVSVLAELIDAEVMAIIPNWKPGAAFDDHMEPFSLEQQYVKQPWQGTVHTTDKFSPSTSLTSSKGPFFYPASSKQTSCPSTKENIINSYPRSEGTMHGRFEEVECLYNGVHNVSRIDGQNGRLSENWVRLDDSGEAGFAISSQVSVSAVQEDVSYPNNTEEFLDIYKENAEMDSEHSKYTRESYGVDHPEEYAPISSTAKIEGCSESSIFPTEHVHDVNDHLKSDPTDRHMVFSSENELNFVRELKFLDQAHVQELRALQMRHEDAILQLKCRYGNGKRSLESPLSVCSTEQVENGMEITALQDLSYFTSSNLNEAYGSTCKKNIELEYEVKMGKKLSDHSNFSQDCSFPVCAEENCQRPTFLGKAVLSIGNKRKSSLKETGTPWDSSPRFDNLAWRELDAVDGQDDIDQGDCHIQLDECIECVASLPRDTRQVCPQNLAESSLAQCQKCLPLHDMKCQGKLTDCVDLKEHLKNTNRPQASVACNCDKTLNHEGVSQDEKHESSMKHKSRVCYFSATNLEKVLEPERAEKVFPRNPYEIKCRHATKSPLCCKVPAVHQEELQTDCCEHYLLDKVRENDRNGHALQKTRELVNDNCNDGIKKRGVFASLKLVVEQDCKAYDVKPADDLKKEQLRRYIAEMEAKTLEGLHSKMMIWPVTNCQQNR